MTVSLLLVFELALIGTVTGFLAGLLGVGGGMMMVPFITLLLTNREVTPDLAVKAAIATSMATIVFTSLSSTRAHHRLGAVRWDLVKRLTPGLVVGSLLASLGAFALLKGSWLATFFGLFVGFSATRMLAGARAGSVREVPGTPGLLTAGGGIGFLSGLVGAGGAFISVPLMSSWNVPIRNAVATSAALGFPIAVANVSGYMVGGRAVAGMPPGSIGYLWITGLAVIATASVLMAPLGARTAHVWPVHRLRRVFAAILYVLAAYMLYKGLTNA